MSFAKKQALRIDGRPKACKEKLREDKVATLRSLNNPDARKVLKRMNDVVYRGSRSNLKEWYKPNGGGISAKP